MPAKAPITEQAIITGVLIGESGDENATGEQATIVHVTLMRRKKKCKRKVNLRQPD